MSAPLLVEEQWSNGPFKTGLLLCVVPYATCRIWSVQDRGTSGGGGIELRRLRRHDVFFVADFLFFCFFVIKHSFPPL